MLDREYVIEALENCSAPDGKCKNCPYVPCESFECSKSKYPDDLVREAIKLLKGPEPKVLTLEETHLREDYWYWVEIANGDVEHEIYHLRCVLVGDEDVDFETPKYRFYVCNDDYGRLWRVWSTMPTDDQMEATPWIM